MIPIWQWDRRRLWIRRGHLWHWILWRSELNAIIELRRLAALDP